MHPIDGIGTWCSKTNESQWNNKRTDSGQEALLIKAKQINVNEAKLYRSEKDLQRLIHSEIVNNHRNNISL